jgi:hypothetical protein
VFTARYELTLYIIEVNCIVIKLYTLTFNSKSKFSGSHLKLTVTTLKFSFLSFFISSASLSFIPYCSYQEDERAKAGNLTKRCSVSPP